MLTSLQSIWNNTHNLLTNIIRGSGKIFKDYSFFFSCFHRDIKKNFDVVAFYELYNFYDSLLVRAAIIFRVFGCCFYLWLSTYLFYDGTLCELWFMCC